MLLLLQKSNTKQVANKEVTVDADVKSAADVCECACVCACVRAAAPLWFKLAGLLQHSIKGDRTLR